MITFRVLLSWLLICLSSLSHADGFPAKPVRMILPFPAGSAADAVVRIVTDKLARTWETPVIVDNRPGAGGTIGVALAASSQPDGYVLLAHSSTYAISPVLHEKPPYDAVRDFLPLAALGYQPYVLVTAPASGWQTHRDLVAAGRARGGRLNFGSAGVGSSTHLVAEKFRIALSIETTHVPYRSIADLMADTMGSRIDYWFPPLGAAVPLIRDRRLTGMAVTGSERSTFLPQVATFAEAGLPGMQETNWFGMWAPIRTPTTLHERIARDIANAVATSEVQNRLASASTHPLQLSRSEFDRLIRSEIERTVSTIRLAGIPKQ